MIFLPFLHFFCLLVCLYLAFFVLYKDPKSLLNRTCAILLLCFAVWNFGDIIIQNPDVSIKRDFVHQMQNLGSIGWIGFASALLCFSLAFSKRDKLLKNKFLLFTVIVFPLFFIYLQWTNSLTTNLLRQPYGWSFGWANTIWTDLFFIYYFLVTSISILIIWVYGRKTKSVNERKQAKIITISVIVSLIIGTVFDVGFQKLGIYSVPTMADLVILIFAIGLSYSIVKYRFLTITPTIAAEKIISAMDELLILLNQEGNILNVNKATLDLLQYEQKELEGKSISMLFQKDDFNNKLLEILTNKKGIKNQDSIILTKTGKKIPIIYSVSHLKNEQGLIIGTVFIARDITERKQAEEELRKTKEDFQGYFEMGSVGNCVTSLDKGWLEVNNRLCQMLGYTKRELIRMTWAEITHPDDLESDTVLFEQVLAGKIDKYELDKRFIRKDGSTVYTTLNVTCHRNSVGSEHHFLASLLDITERKLAEEEIKLKNEQLVKANAEKDKFFSIIAHDLRSPFNTFLGLSRIIANELPSLTMDEIQKFAINLENSADNLYRLLENLLQWSQIKQGLMFFSPEVVQLRPVIIESIEMMEESATSKKIIIANNIPENIYVLADNHILKSVIRNLVSNALKFTYKGGKITLSAKSLGNNTVEIAVSDTGIGMSPEMIQNLFRIDVQTNRKGTEGEPSSGLGLILCNDFIQLHGGKIWVESEEGIGSTFYFSLPVSNNE